MPRGFFTQSATVLFSEAPSIEAIASALETLDVPMARRTVEAGWLSGGTELLVPFGDELGGHVHVDVVAESWPDSMGDPEAEPSLFAAWSMGAFGPLAFPRNLERAVAQAVSFEDAERLVSGHTAFVRLRTSYLVGAGPESTVMPEGWSAFEEIHAMIQVVRPLLALEGAIAYFDPNAEVLLPAEGVRRVLDSEEAEGATPLELFAHVRLFNIDPTWAMMDTIGMDRFFLPDVEVLITRDVDPNEVEGFLRNLSGYLLENGGAIEDGHSVETPFGVVHVHARDESLTEPPRRVLRLVPDGAELPDGAL